MNRSDRMNAGLTVASALCGLLAAACAVHQAGPATARAAPGAKLPGTAWRLVEFQSPDDRIGTVRPDNPAAYTMALEPGGRVALRLNCNRGAGTWTATATGPDSGSFRFGPLAVTKAFCQPPSPDVQIARNAEYIRSYVLRNGRLYLNLMADGGTYVWEPAGGLR
jgi:heat shock protein HslJ